MLEKMVKKTRQIVINKKGKKSSYEHESENALFKIQTVEGKFEKTHSSITFEPFIGTK